MNDITKLPKWAQRYIEKLNSDIEDLTEKVGLLSGGDQKDGFEAAYEPGRGVLVDVHSDNPVRFRERTLVRFRPGDGRDDYIDVAIRDGELTLNSADALAVIPVSSNLVKVRLVDYHLPRGGL